MIIRETDCRFLSLLEGRPQVESGATQEDGVQGNLRLPLLSLRLFATTSVNHALAPPSLSFSRLSVPTAFLSADVLSPHRSFVFSFK